MTPMMPMMMRMPMMLTLTMHDSQNMIVQGSLVDKPNELKIKNILTLISPGTYQSDNILLGGEINRDTKTPHFQTSYRRYNATWDRNNIINGILTAKNDPSDTGGFYANYTGL